MKRRWVAGLAGLGALASLIAHFPLSWAAKLAAPDVPGLSYSGTIWNGQVRGVPLLSQLDVSGFLIGAAFDTGPGQISLSGKATPSSVRDLNLVMPIADLPAMDPQLAALSGMVTLKIDQAEFDSSGCQAATGTAATNVLSANGARFGWTGPALDGPVDCDGGRLRVRLSGDDGQTQVSALILTGMDGTYRSDLTVRSSDPNAGAALALFGFRQSGEGYSLSEQGRWR